MTDKPTESEPTIIHSFRQRRQLEEALLALEHAASEQELQQQTRQLAEQFPAELLLPTVVKHLGTQNSQLRGGLGQLCALLPAESVVPTLRAVVGNRQKSPIERTTAATLLERYLGEPVSSALLADLAGNNDAAYQSLLEAVEEGRENRHVLLEYVTQMQQHPAEVAFMVLDLLEQLPADQRTPLLRLIALDERPQVARSALDRLARAATDDPSPAALAALHTLPPMLSPGLAPLAERALRKLQFSGRRYQAPTTQGWRALFGPADAGGFFHLWLLREPGEEDNGALLGFLLQLDEGIVQFSGTEGMERGYLPPARPVGELMLVEGARGQATLFLEAPFDLGRWLVQQATATHLHNSAARPLAGEYRLYSDLIWQFDAPQIQPAWSEWLNTPIRSQPVTERETLARAAEALVHHHAMRAWLLWSAAVWRTLQPPSAPELQLPAPALVTLLLRELSQLPDHTELLQAMACGLRVQALWFHIAGEPQFAHMAAHLAATIQSLPVQESPLLAALLTTGLQLMPRRA